jgi:hypothetical protein
MRGIFLKSNELIPLPVLLRLVLRQVYDKKSMGFYDREKMENGIEAWFKYITTEKKKIINKFGIEAEGFAPVGKKGTPLDEQEFQIMGMAWLLREDEEGRLEARKEMFRLHKIDYKKFYKLPEAYNPRDFVAAQEALKKNKKEFPELYEGSRL